MRRDVGDRVTPDRPGAAGVSPYTDSRYRFNERRHGFWSIFDHLRWSDRSQTHLWFSVVYTLARVTVQLCADPCLPDAVTFPRVNFAVYCRCRRRRQMPHDVYIFRFCHFVIRQLFIKTFIDCIYFLLSNQYSQLRFVNCCLIVLMKWNEK